MEYQISVNGRSTTDAQAYFIVADDYLTAIRTVNNYVRILKAASKLTQKLNDGVHNFNKEDLELGYDVGHRNSKGMYYQICRCTARDVAGLMLAELSNKFTIERGEELLVRGKKCSNKENDINYYVGIRSDRQNMFFVLCGCEFRMYAYMLRRLLIEKFDCEMITAREADDFDLWWVED